MSKHNPKANGVHLPFEDQQFKEKWQEWLQYRKERRLAAYTPTGLKATFTRLKKISSDNYEIAMQIIDQSLEQGWQGLFEIKAPSNGTKHIPNTTGGSQSANGTSAQRIQAAKDF